MDPPRTGAGPSAGAPRGPRLVPILLLGSSGRVRIPGPDGPEDARTPEGERVDLFDLTDYLADRYRRLYVVDLDGIERNRPQLDYLQELTKDTDVWVDAGVPNADAVIDILVAGARRAVVCTGRFPGMPELRKAWKYTPELVLELDVGGPAQERIDEHWGPDPRAAASMARELGLTDLIVSPHTGTVDWELVRTVADGGPTWVDGAFGASEAARLEEVGAAGGFFHITRVLEEFAARPVAR